MKYFDIIFFIVLILCFLFGALFIKRWKYISKCLFLCIPILCFYCSFIYDGKETTGKESNFKDNNQQQVEQQCKQDIMQKEINQEKTEIDNAISVITDAMTINNQSIETQVELISKTSIIPQYIYKQIERTIKQIDKKLASSGAIQVQNNEKLKKLKDTMESLEQEIKQNRPKKIRKKIKEIYLIKKTFN